MDKITDLPAAPTSAALSQELPPPSRAFVAWVVSSWDTGGLTCVRNLRHVVALVSTFIDLVRQRLRTNDITILIYIAVYNFIILHANNVLFAFLPAPAAKVAAGSHHQLLPQTHLTANN